jgi:hypothetical protein
MDELTKLCDEIAGMFPSPNLKDTTTSQFKTFLNKLQESKVDPAQIKALKQAYNYFNYLMGDIGDSNVPDSKESSSKESGSKDNDSKESGSKDSSSKDSTSKESTSKESSSKESEENKGKTDDPESEMIEILLNLAEASESTRIKD